MAHKETRTVYFGQYGQTLSGIITYATAGGNIVQYEGIVMVSTMAYPHGIQMNVEDLRMNR